MAGHRLVVTDRDLTPRGEVRVAERRVPRAAGTREVLRWAGVVHRRRAARWCDHRLAAVERRRNVEMLAIEVVDRAVDQVLDPREQRALAFDHASRIRLEVVDRRMEVGTGQDAVAAGGDVTLDAPQLLPTPRVRLVQIELRTAI